IAIGRAVQQAGTTMDISQGAQPSNPPASTVRLWADGSGNLHVLSPTGTDKTLIDSSSALGGDLYGTFGAAHISVQANQNVQMSNNSYLLWSDCSIVRWNPAQIRISGSGGATIQGPLNVEGSSSLVVGGPATFLNTLSVSQSLSIGSDFNLSFAVNGYYLKGVSGQAQLFTNASLVVGAGAVYFDSSASVRWYWDGTNLHANRQLYCDNDIVGNNIHSLSGSYYAGGSNQSQIGIWNPGEWRIGSSPGNLYAIGIIQSDQYTNSGGSGARGNGAYVNTASSFTVKTNITELDSNNCLAQVLDSRMRPVKFEYITPLAPSFENVPSENLIGKSVRSVEWTDEKLGFIAEEVAVVVPEAAGIIEGTDVAHGLTIESLIPILWGAIRELDARVKRLEPA
ncbi:MAG TPA: hypothetical protein VGE97_05285, partial [Nitrososphaera sp.]